MTPQNLARPMSPASSGLPVDPQATLSKYLPEGASYFYGFPAGNGSDFYNNVPAWVEELVSARTLVCAGPTVHPVVFSSVSSPQIRHWLTEECGMSISSPENCIQIPETVSDDLAGNERNNAVRSALISSLDESSLFMAQPFLDTDVSSLFRINPTLSAKFNDKTYLPAYVPSEYVPARFASFAHGQDFSEASSIPVPCVVKVASSSAGDGVRMCKTQDDVLNAQNAFKDVKDNIFIEEFVEAKDNYCIQFGIPHNAAAPIEIIGYNHQVITDVGEFLGSVVCPPHIISNPVLHEVFTLMVHTILPRVREEGWYGVGGLDVLISESGKFYFIDPNFRQTATFNLVSLARRGLMKKKAVGFIGTYKGTKEGFEKILAYANPTRTPHILQMVSISEKDSLYRFNAGLLFENSEELTQNVTLLHSMGVEGKVIDLIMEGHELHI